MTQTKTLTLSLVIPACNEEDYLKTCLQSIAVQTVNPDEVIVIDNNSTDKTSSVAKQFPFVKVRKESQQGIVFARNYGFNLVSSQIIARIDADTVLPKTWVEEVKRFYENPKNSAKALTGGGYFINLPFKKLGEFLHRYGYFYLTRALMGSFSVFGSNMAIPKKLWLAVKNDTCSRTNIHEDIDLTIHLNQLGYPTVFNKAISVGVVMRKVVHHRQALNKRMAMWHKTLRVHNHKSWVVTLLFGSGLQVLYPVMLLIVYFSRPASTQNG